MRAAQRQSGFTLPELLVGLLVMSFVMLGITSVYVSNQRAYNRGQVQVEIHQNARVGMETLARELRMAGYDPQNEISLLASPSVFQVATAGTLTFLADLDGDDTVDQIAYRRQGDRLIREFSSWDGTSFPAPTVEELSAGLLSFGFVYSDGTLPTNTVLPPPVTGTTLWDIRRIGVVMRTSGQTVDGQQSTYDLSIDVRPRNLP